MKTNRILSATLALIALALVAGCSSFPERLAEFDQLGIKSAEITGKFSSTQYHREDKDGVTTSTFTHSNPWVQRVEIVRERPSGQP